MCKSQEIEGVNVSTQRLFQQLNGELNAFLKAYGLHLIAGIGLPLQSASEFASIVAAGKELERVFESSHSG